MKLFAILALMVSMPLQATPIELLFSNDWKFVFDDNTNTVTGDTTVYDEARIIDFSALGADSASFVSGRTRDITATSFFDFGIFEIDIRVELETPGNFGREDFVGLSLMIDSDVVSHTIFNGRSAGIIKSS